MRCLFSVFAVVVLLGPEVAWAQEGLPKGSAPTLISVRLGSNPELIDVGRLVPVQEVRNVTEFVPRIVEVQQGGQVVQKTELVPVTRQITVTVQRSVPASYKLKDVAFYNLKGQRIADEQVRKALGTKGAPVLLGQSVVGGQQKTLAGIDPFYLQAFREGTLVVVLPEAPALQVPAPVKKLPPAR